MSFSPMEEWNARADPEDQRSDDFLVGRQEQLQSLKQKKQQLQPQE